MRLVHMLRPMIGAFLFLAALAMPASAASSQEASKDRSSGWSPSCEWTPHYLLQPDSKFRVHPTSPRLWFRQRDIPWLKARSKGSMRADWDRLRSFAEDRAKLDPTSDKVAYNVKNWHGNNSRAVAFVGLLTENKSYIDWSVRWAKKMASYKIAGKRVWDIDTPARSRLQRMATVYDWLKDKMSEEDRHAIRDGIIHHIEAMREWPYIKNPGYTGGHERWGYGAFSMGLIAVYEDYAEAPKLLKQCRKHIAKGMFPTQAWICKDGGTHMGWAYGGSYFDFNKPYFAWTTATNDILLDDWMAKQTHHWMYGLRGDGTYASVGDAWGRDISLGERNMVYGAGPGKMGLARWYFDVLRKGKGPAFLKFLVMNPTVRAEKPDKLPLARHFRNSGVVIARDRWDKETTHLAFKSTSFRSRNHHHQDENSFTLHYKTPLAIDTGYYDSYGSEHWRNYFTRTIAHNAILVRDPKQKFKNGGKAVSNDGGQVYPGQPKTLKEIQPGGQASLDGVTRYEHRDEFTYAVGDATKAYDKTRVQLAQREMVYLRDTSRGRPVIVVFDRVRAGSPEYRKQFVLHPAGKPRKDGRLMTSDSKSARLSCLTVLPESAELKLVGGKGKEFWVDGKNYPPKSISRARKLGFDTGEWRMEVTATAKRSQDFFLHALFVDDAGAKAVEPGDVKLIQDDRIAGIQVAGWTVIFRKDAEPKKNLNFTIQPAAGSRILVTGVVPNTEVRVQVDGEGKNLRQVAGEGGCVLYHARNAKAITFQASGRPAHLPAAAKPSGQSLPAAPASTAKRAHEVSPARRASIRDKFKGWIIQGVESGKKATVYLNVAGTLSRARLVRASDTGIVVQALGNELPIAWEQIQPRRLYGTAKRYAPPGDSDAEKMLREFKSSFQLTESN